MSDIERGLAAAQPVAWIRYCTDGGIEGPILHSQMEEVRIRSGAWTPLYASPDLAAAQREREACALLCEQDAEFWNEHGDLAEAGEALHLAVMIRARGGR